jgi:hypothetical protein
VPFDVDVPPIRVKTMPTILRLRGVIFALLITGGSSPVAVSAQQRGQQDQWVNPGVGPSSPTDATLFVRGTDGAFVGVLESVSVKFADDEQRWLFTSLRFRVTEWLYNTAGRSVLDRVDVLTVGGTYAERGNQRVPTGTADIAKGLRVGGHYFVPVKYASLPDHPWNGEPLLAGVDALTELRDQLAASVQSRSRWADAIAANDGVTQPTPGAPLSQRERFMAAIRAAAVRK